MGLGLGVSMFVIFCAYALAFWYGNLRVGKDMTSGEVVTVFFSVIIGAFAIGQSAPAINAINEARGAAPKIFQVVARESQIDPFDVDGLVEDSITGAIQLTDVDFTYRGRPDRLVLNKLSFTIEPGERQSERLTTPQTAIGIPPDRLLLCSAAPVARSCFYFPRLVPRSKQGTMTALVGESGCGKSTTIQLLERFYDPIDGSITLDGRDLREYNVQWLRSQMGFVSQMPTLFALSIFDNIALGAGLTISEDEDGKRIFAKKRVSDEEVYAAAKLANAHDFIMKLPETYNTVLGDRGAQLSGGQKQRVAIARALVRDPKILLLDEATSALDTSSERIVQEAIDRAQEGRTTVVIAHRLSTIRKANKIAVFDKGAIVEWGTHEELMGQEVGTYKNLVKLQNIDGAEAQQDLRENKSLTEGMSTKYSLLQSSADGKSKADEEKEDEAVEEEEVSTKGVMWRTLRANAPEWPYLLVGTVGAILNGVIWPIFAIVFSEITVVLVNPDSTVAEVNRWALFFFAIGCASFFTNLSMYYAIGASGEYLTNRLRIWSFKALIRQNIGFFDLRENSVGQLTSRLAHEASKVKGISGDRLGNMLTMVSTMVTAIIVAFIYCWRLAFVVLATVPLFAVGGMLQMKMMSGFAGELDKLFHRANSIAIEVIDNIHTVIALGAGERFLAEYNQELEVPSKAGKRKAAIAALAFGFTEFCMFAIWGLAFW